MTRASFRIERAPLRSPRAAAINPSTKIIYLANPNNPTGTIFTKHQFDDFYRHVPERVLIILDEAYFEYAKDNPRYPDSMHYRYDNVITLRTFSKVYGLAGIRIGYGFAHETLIANLLKIKLPFEPSTLAQAAGIGATISLRVGGKTDRRHGEPLEARFTVRGLYDGRFEETQRVTHRRATHAELSGQVLLGADRIARMETTFE